MINTANDCSLVFCGEGKAKVKKLQTKRV